MRQISNNETLTIFNSNQEPQEYTFNNFQAQFEFMSQNRRLFPVSQNEQETELISSINNSDLLTPLREQVVRNVLNNQNSLSNFPELINNLPQNELNTLFSLLEQSVSSNSFFPALTLLGVFTNFSDVNLDSVISTMMLQILDIQSTNLTVFNGQSSLNVQQITDLAVANINSIASDHESRVLANQNTFLNDLSSRALSVVRRIRINNVYNGIFRTLLSRPELFWTFGELTLNSLITARRNNRTAAQPTPVNEAPRQTNTDSRGGTEEEQPELRKILISIFDWFYGMLPKKK